MRRRVTARWRPPLALVLGGTLLAVLGLPVIAIAGLRVFGNILGWGEAAAISAAVALLAALILGWLLWRLVLRPVRSLTAYARAVERGGEAEPPGHLGTPELGALAQSVIDMGAALNAREAVLRGYADHVTHELKSPLTAIAAAAELLPEAADPGERAALTSRIGEAAERMTRLLDAQRRLARAEDPSLGGEVRLSALLAALRAAHPGLELVLRGDATLPLSEDGARLILDQLLSNALSAGATGVEIAGTGDGITLRDDGPGVSAGNAGRIFEPYFTTRRSGGGTGMGLAIVSRVLEVQGGRIALAGDGPGARFEITF